MAALGRRAPPLALPLVALVALGALACAAGLEAQVSDTTGALDATRRVRAIAPGALQRERLRARNGVFTQRAVRDGVPAGVECDAEERCDSANVCARVCARGSVRLDPWLAWAVGWQWSLARRQPLCYAQLLGTHNSAISLADGYGSHDDVYTQYLRYVGLASGGQRLQTSNQLLSLTDQLNMGVRFVELDVHWIQGSLRIAHCGGFHSDQLNALVRLLSRVASLFGHPPVEWDAETLGCDPSLSSLPTRDQRLFSEALDEVAAWLARPESAEEFLVLYFDDQPDLQRWGRVADLLAQVTAVIPRDEVISPPELRGIAHELGGRMPSIAQLVRQYGKRVLLQSATDYGPDMSHLVFNHRAPCNFTEPLVQGFTGAPNCSYHGMHWTNYSMPLAAGRLVRTPTCHLTYGPYNCSLQRGDNTPQFDEELLPQAALCGVSVPAPDALDPQLLRSFVWSWAPGHPPPQPQQQGVVQDAARRSSSGSRAAAMEDGVEAAAEYTGDGQAGEMDADGGGGEVPLLRTARTAAVTDGEQDVEEEEEAVAQRRDRAEARRRLLASPRRLAAGADDNNDDDDGGDRAAAAAAAASGRFVSEGRGVGSMAGAHRAGAAGPFAAASGGGGDDLDAVQGGTGGGGGGGGRGGVAAGGGGAAAAAPQCAMMRLSDGRWEVRGCTEAAFRACRLDAGPAHVRGRNAWALPPTAGGDCPRGYIYDAPHTARESHNLHLALVAAAAQAGGGGGSSGDGDDSAGDEGGGGDGDTERYALLALQPPDWLPAGLARDAVATAAAI